MGRRPCIDLAQALDDPAVQEALHERAVARAEEELRDMQRAQVLLATENIRLEHDLARARHERLDIAITRHLVRLDELRPVPGVYLLFGVDDEVIYVGQSENVLRRMAGHTDKPYVRARMIALNLDQLGGVERALIQHFLPKLNTHHRRAT